ncbi:ribosome silencing factor [Miniphocaeibacter halophilus]|uniref:Ribosome silencing factor n=1 Tax=Miniphocaeibacter halophilus TaxID=2931922 RepID=A0AC61MVS8_9FIRM|nr:ribosome silencing factor [Miniphocaeibacter halophilus]QQK07163.1 ribosome silencing factor [Miniphocaeibacter halophilus]
MEDKVQLIVKACEDKIGKDIKIIELEKGRAIADYFIIVTGNTPNQTQAIADEVEKVAMENEIEVFSKEGYRDGNWILVDLGDIILHVFTPEFREYYDLERLWSK